MGVGDGMNSKRRSEQRGGRVIALNALFAPVGERTRKGWSFRSFRSKDVLKWRKIPGFRFVPRSLRPRISFLDPNEMNTQR